MYLNGELAKKTDEILELQERMQMLVEDSEKQAIEHEARMMAAKDASALQAAKLTEDVSFYKAKLDKIHKFIAEKQEMEENIEALNKKIEEDALTASNTISDLERKHVQEKDRLKKEMLYKLRETKANLLKMTDNQLDTTTKRTIAENEQMASELAWQSKETEKLIKKNDKLMSENAHLKRELSLQEQIQEEFARKVNVYQKTISTLMSKLNQVGAEHEADIGRREHAADDIERDRSESIRERDILNGLLNEAKADLQDKDDLIHQRESQFQQLEAKHAKMLMLQDESVKFTLKCLEDLQGTMPSSGAMEREGASLSSLDPSKRLDVMEYLLGQLQAYQHQLKELELHEAWKQHTSMAAIIPPPSSIEPTGHADHRLPPINRGGTPPKKGLWAGGPPPTLGGRNSRGNAASGGIGELGGAVEISVGDALRPWGHRKK